MTETEKDTRLSITLFVIATLIVTAWIGVDHAEKERIKQLPYAARVEPKTDWQPTYNRVVYRCCCHDISDC